MFFSNIEPFWLSQRAKQLKQRKEEGNQLFKSHNWTKALEVYNEALLIDPFNKITNAKLYFNRAIVSAKVKQDIRILS